MIPEDDLDQGRDDNMQEKLVVGCQLNGMYDINIKEWACTKKCPLPSLPQPDIMAYDWPDTSISPEIRQEIRHSCLDGRQLVSKVAFETAAKTAFYEEIMSSCQVVGWFNESIGSYTCTRGCPPPFNQSDVFNHDWSPERGSDIGLTVK